jgi:hypothetical protein
MNQTNLYSFTSKHLWLLFFIVIPVNIFDILTTELFASYLPSTIYTFSNYGIIICNLLYGLILLKLSKEHDFYKTAGIVSIFSTFINLWLTFINGGPLEFNVSDGFGFGALALAFISVICSILIIFFETNGHADILGRYDYELSSKWDKLRKWYIYIYCGLGSSFAIIFILPLIGLLIMLASLITLCVLVTLKYVYLYKTAKVFTNLSKEENVSRETF